MYLPPHVDRWISDQTRHQSHFHRQAQVTAAADARQEPASAAAHAQQLTILGHDGRGTCLLVDWR